MTYKPGTTIMLTSGFAPFPQIPEGLYTIEENNTIQITIKNSSTGTISLLQNRPIPGIVAHGLKLGYHDPVEINKNTLRALFLKDQTVEAAKMAGLIKEENNTNAKQLATPHIYVQKQTHIIKAIMGSKIATRHDTEQPPWLHTYWS